MDNRKLINAGLAAEETASHFLQAKGITLLHRNYRCRSGEIDLIMRDHEDIIFVEVRLRNNKNYADAIESVNLIKQKKIIKTAMHYLYKYNLLDEVNCRFDIIGISYAHTKATIEWIQDAFLADDF
jgi:putative endonuclease